MYKPLTELPPTTLTQKLRLPPAGASYRASTGMVVLATVVLIVVFFLPIKRSWTMSVDENYTRVFVNYGVPDGEAWARPLAMAMLLGFGLVASWWPGGRALHLDRLPAVLWVGFLAWCGLTCLWADDRNFALMRFAGDLCGAAAAYGLCKRVSAYQFVWILFGTTVGWLGLGLLAEFVHGTFRPWDPEHRFAGIMHPNGMGSVCALVVLSAVYLARHEPAYRRRLLAVAAVALLSLYFCRSRTALLSMMMALSVGWMCITPRIKVVFGVSLAAPLLATLALVLGSDAMNAADTAVSMGRSESKVSSLTNRLPLWQELMPFIAERPISAYSYCFWMEDHDFVEPAQSAHSIYFDALLSFGVIGAGLYFGGLVVAIGRAAQASAERLGYGFLGMLLVFFLISGFSETLLGFTHSFGFFVFAAVCFTSFRELPEGAAVEVEWQPTAQLVPS
jgi:O-antigen ligase